MPVRRMLSSVLFRSIEPRLREWQAAHPPPSPPTDPGEPAPASKSAVDALGAKLVGVEEQNAKLEKKLSMAMGAIQAATAQIIQLRQELEQATNLSRQAMQKATTAQSTAESASEGLEKLEELATRPAADAAGADEAEVDVGADEADVDVGADDAPALDAAPSVDSDAHDDDAPTKPDRSEDGLADAASEPGATDEPAP